MATSLRRSFRLSSTLKIEEEAMVITKNQGISSILTATDCERSVTSSSSLKRTLSADMSSAKWLTTQMKKIASSEEFSVSSINDSSSSYEEEDDDDDDEEEREEQSDDSETEPQSQFDIWSSIQKKVYGKKELEKPGQFDIWSSIISQKEQENNNDKSSPPPPPYIHPLVRRSISSLSEKSLEICTESLGSETGSDGFSSYPQSETETADGEDDKEMEQEQKQLHDRVTAAPGFNFEQLQIPKDNSVVSKRSRQRSFPPPIPSLSRQDGASIRMQSLRNNGRLVLEAVSVPSANNFGALRQDGRLVLTFINSYATVVSNKEEADVLEEEFENLEDEEEERESEAEEEEEEEERESDAEEEEIEEEEEEEAEEKEVEFVTEQAPKITGGVMSVYRLPMAFANRDPRWPKNFNEVVKFNEEEGVHIKSTTIVAQSLPPRMARLIPKSPGTTAGATGTTGVSFNAYEYYWRPKTVVGAQYKGKSNTNMDDYNTNKLILSKKSIENRHEQQQLLVLRGNEGDYLVPLLKSCKEPKRSLMFWEPNCAAMV